MLIKTGVVESGIKLGQNVGRGPISHVWMHVFVTQLLDRDLGTLFLVSIHSV